MASFPNGRERDRPLRIGMVTRDVPLAAVPDAFSRDEIDILIDLAGHTNYAQMAAFAERLVPVQATFLGPTIRSLTWRTWAPRLHRGRLWLVQAGTGEFGTVEPASGRFEPITFLPGSARGIWRTRCSVSCRRRRSPSMPRSANIAR